MIKVTSSQMMPFRSTASKFDILFIFSMDVDGVGTPGDDAHGSLE